MGNPTILVSDTASSSVDLFEAYLVPNILFEMGRRLNWDAKARVFLGAVLSLLSTRGGEVECYGMTFGKWLYPNLGDDSARQKVTRDLGVLRQHQQASNVELVVMRAGDAKKISDGKIRCPPTIYAFGQFPSLFERVQRRCINGRLFEMRPSVMRARKFSSLVNDAVRESGLVPIPDWQHDEWAEAKRAARKKKADILPGPLGLVMDEKRRQEIRHMDREDAFAEWLDKRLQPILGELDGIPDTIDDMAKFRKLTAQVIESSFVNLEKNIRLKNRLGR